jgi:hypothetical protein
LSRIKNFKVPSNITTPYQEAVQADLENKREIPEKEQLEARRVSIFDFASMIISDPSRNEEPI